MNKKPKFVTPVAMECTRDRFKKDLRKPLEALGYEIGNSAKEYDGTIIFNSPENSIISCSSAMGYKLPPYFIDHYNPELFLSLVAMTDGDFPIEGEWILSIKHCENQYGDLLHIVGKLYKMMSIDSTIAEDGIPHDISNKVFFNEYFRKPTKDELIAHFTKKSGVMVTVIEQTYHTDEELKNAVDRNQRIESALLNLVQLRTYKQEFGETELFKKMESTCWREAVEALEP